MFALNWAHILYHIKKRNSVLRKCMFLEVMEYVHKFANQEMLV